MRDDLECTRAVILAAGRGTRMRATDDGIQLGADQAAAADSGNKAMMPVGRPFLDYVLSGLADAGFTRICIVVAPGNTVIQESYSGSRAPTRFTLSYAVQTAPLGSANAVLSAREFSNEQPFVVLNADNYYPTGVLERLRRANGPAGVAFSREGLLRSGDIPAERIASYAILDIDAAGRLRRIVEKPDLSSISGVEQPVSMNCWRLTAEMFRACSETPPSPRGEVELPVAVQYGIEHLGLHFEMIRADAPVLDLSRRSDVPRVTERLRSIDVQL